MRLPSWIAQHLAALRALLVLTVLTGLAYPLLVTGAAQLPGLRDKANGSLIKSAVFLSEFVTVPWVHVDIAGTAYLGAEKPYGPKGATGAAVGTLVRLALDFTSDAVDPATDA